MNTPESFNARSADLLPGFMGVVVTRLADGEVDAEIELGAKHMAPNGFLHAAAVISLADSACGHGCLANLPEGAESFTTVELKSNHLGTARDGTITCTARAVHKGEDNASVGRSGGSSADWENHCAVSLHTDDSVRASLNECPAAFCVDTCLLSIIHSRELTRDSLFLVLPIPVGPAVCREFDIC